MSGVSDKMPKSVEAPVQAPDNLNCTGLYNGMSSGEGGAPAKPADGKSVDMLCNIREQAVTILAFFIWLAGILSIKYLPAVIFARIFKIDLLGVFEERLNTFQLMRDIEACNLSCFAKARTRPLAGAGPVFNLGKRCSNDRPRCAIKLAKLSGANAARFASFVPMLLLEAFLCGAPCAFDRFLSRV